MRGTRYKTEEKERIKVKEEEHLIVLLGLREEIGMKTYLHGPIDFARENDETAISCRGPEPDRKKKEV